MRRLGAENHIMQTKLANRGATDRPSTPHFGALHRLSHRITFV